MNAAKVVVNNPGPIIPVMPRSEPMAPWSRPCSVGFTRRDMIDCVGGLANPHSEPSGTASQNIHGCVASPYNVNPNAPHTDPARIAPRSPTQASTFLMSTVCTRAEQTPALPSIRPTVRSLRPKRVSA